MRNLSKKAKTIIAGAAIAGLASTGVAYAYWTTTGSGGGSASTTSNTVVLSYSQDAGQVALGLYPGQAAQPIAGTVKNDAATGGQYGYVGTVTATIKDVTQTVAGLAAGGCDATDYTLGSAPVAVNTDLEPQGTASFGGQTIQFNNKTGLDANQDGCQGATVNLTFTSN